MFNTIIKAIGQSVLSQRVYLTAYQRGILQSREGRNSNSLDRVRDFVSVKLDFSRQQGNYKIAKIHILTEN